MAVELELLDLVGAAHIPVDTVLGRKYNLGQGGSPATASHYCNFSGQIHHESFIIWLRW